MKKNLKIYLAAGLMALTAVSCTDLDVTPESQYTQYPASDIALEAKMADIYFHLRETLGRRYMEAQALSSDEWTSISFDGDYYDSGTYANTSEHNFQISDASIDWYNKVTEGITKATRVIFEMGGEEGSPEGTAPARAMRAYYTWILMDCFGDTPILDRVMEKGDVAERKPRAEVARWIESELLDIIPLLTKDNNATTYGKPNRWMAEALLIKLYINWPVYTADKVQNYDAASYSNEKLNDLVALCNDIIESGEFDLAAGADGYLSKFYPNNGPQIKDFIYAMPYDAISAQGFQYSRPRIWRQGRNDGNGGPGYFGSDIGNSTGGNFSITPQMADLFTLPGDQRNDHILAGKIYMYDPVTYKKTTTPFKYKGAEVILTKEIELKNGDEYIPYNSKAYPAECNSHNTGKDVHGWSQGYKSVKYFVIADDFKNNRNQSNDLPIFRYADILLMKAEALVRGASDPKGQTAQELFNMIRSYAGAPTLDHNPSLKELLDERGREFFDENWRRNDMIRFGTFESEYGFHLHNMPGARFDKTCRIFPLPESALNTNTSWKQNEGY